MREMYALLAASALMLTLEAETILKPGRVEVVIEKNAPKTVAFAAEELTNFLAQAFGAEVPVRTRGSASLPIQIVLGETEAARAAGVDVTNEPRDSFVIKTVGNRIFIVGRDDPKADPWHVLDHGNWNPVCFERATLFGVYEFLERFVGVRFYFPGELGTIVPRKAAVAVSGELRIRPDFKSRFLQMWHGEYFEPDPKNRQKTLSYFRQRFETFRPPACHGSLGFRYQRRFGKTHPEYFALLPNGKRDVFEKQTFAAIQPGQLCWSSGVVEEMYKDAKSYLKGEDASVRGIPANWSKNGAFGWNGNVSGRKYIDLMPQDGMIACGCPACQASIAACTVKGLKPETYLVWSAVSNIATRLTAEGLDGIVSMMAYNGYGDVPDFALPPNIDVMVATMGPWSVHNAQSLAKDDRMVSAWAKTLGHTVRLWNYPCKLLGMDVKGKDVPQTCPRAWAKFYKHSAPWINGAFAESETDRWFYNYLNYYVFAKVCWDNDVDVDALLDEHYRLMFGAAAKEMSEIYETLEDCWAKGVVGNSINTPMGPVVKRPSEAVMWEKVYSPARLVRFDELVKQARANVAPDSPERRRIDLVDREFLGGLRRRAADYGKFAAGLKALEFALSLGGEKKLELVPFVGGRTKEKKTVRTDVTVRRTDKALVVRFDCEEPRMGDIVERVHTEESPDLWQENVVEIVIDPKGDRTSYVQFFVNSAGSTADCHSSCIYQPTEGWKWNSGFTARVEKGDKSWMAELTIPLAALPDLPQKFAVEFSRERNLTGENDYEHLYHWSPYAYGFSDLDNLGRIVFSD